MKSIKLIYVILFSLILTSCSDLDINMSNPEGSDFAKNYLIKLKSQNLEYLKVNILPEGRDQVTDEILIETSKHIPKGSLLSLEMIGFRINVINENWSGSFTYEFNSPDGWAIGVINLVKVKETFYVTGFNISPTNNSQKELNAFKNVNFSFIKIVMMILTILIPLFMIYTCVSVFRTNFENKWRYYILSFVGLCSFSINLTTSQIFSKYTTLKLLGFGAGAASENAAWYFTFTLPIGALYYWYKRDELIEKSMANKSLKQDS